MSTADVTGSDPDTSTAAEGAPPAAGPAGPAPAGDPAQPGDRGDLTVADRVVEKVAGYAVTLVPDAAAAPRRVLGLNVGEGREEDVANVEARVIGDVATVRARIAVRWPQSVPDAAEAVRRRIRQEVIGITGVRVDHVDVEITSLSVASAERRRVQ